MRNFSKLGGMVFISLLIALIIAGCGKTSEPVTAPASTPTPTDVAGGLPQPQPSEEINPCAGLVGRIEMQILVGPSEVVGMEPVAVGEIPFSVMNQDGVYVLTGGGPLNFDEQVYEAEWGSYTVSFYAETELNGVCEPLDEGQELRVDIVMDGKQDVSVVTGGFQKDCPWEGTLEINVRLPLVEGASQTGEGWMVVLHVEP